MLEVEPITDQRGRTVTGSG